MQTPAVRTGLPGPRSSELFQRFEPIHIGGHDHGEVPFVEARKFGCFIEDHHGIASLGEIGEDNVMCETDYPHSDSTWPDCIGTARRVVQDLTPEVQYKLLRGNAERLYRFTPAEPPAASAAAPTPASAPVAS